MSSGIVIGRVRLISSSVPQSIHRICSFTNVGAQGIRLIAASRSRAFRSRGHRVRLGPASPQYVPCGGSPMDVRLPSSGGVGGWVSAVQWPSRPVVFVRGALAKRIVCDVQAEVLGTTSLPRRSWPSRVYLKRSVLGCMMHVTWAGLHCTMGAMCLSLYWDWAVVGLALWSNNFG